MWTTLCIIALVIAILLRKRRYRWFYIIIKTLPRDLRGLKIFITLFIFSQKCKRANNTIPKQFATVLKQYPQKVAFYFEDEAWTYTQVDEFSNKIGRFFSTNGYKEGDTVAILLENCVEYPCLWLGLLKIGVRAALINTNLVKDSLLHAITITKCKSVIFGSNLAQSVENISENLKCLNLYQIQETQIAGGDILERAVNLSKELQVVSNQKLDEEYINLSVNDTAIYVLTSGTTGLPKAAVMTHLRWLLVAKCFSLFGRTTSNDICYTPLPFYHAATGVIGIGQSLLLGMTVVIRRNFSASQYFKDCEKYNVTVAQYIGELCRYVLATPNNGPTNHKVKTIVGNGLKPQIWKHFVKRFGINNVVEIYGSTEGVAILVNIDNTEGAVGFIPRYLRFLSPLKLVKCNDATGAPLKNSIGRCIECDIDEPGLLIAKINKDMLFLKYDGYTDSKASQHNILRDVFRDGDMYISSGDILVYDELGYYYFKDRTGDTFRWKGENVSTTEIEATISNVVKLTDIAVYGVKIPGTEGRTGMAAIGDPDKNLNIDSFAAIFKNNLPSYAIPLFIRVVDSVPTTETFKLKKAQLRDEGYNVDMIKDHIYFLHPEEETYVILTKELYFDIVSGNIRL